MNLFRTLERPVRFGSRDNQDELISAKMAQDFPSGLPLDRC
jgi:hypothetical protein